MLRYTKILLILLIVGGCIYETGHSLQKNELERAGIDRGKRCTTGTIKPKYAVLPKEIRRERLDKSNVDRQSQKRTENRVESSRDSRIRDRDSSSNVKYTTFLVTAYTKNDAGMNGRGITASGKRARVNHTIAASRGIPLHTKIYFPELGLILTVEDRGGAIKGNRIDLYYGTDLKGAKRFGKRKLKGVIIR